MSAQSTAAAALVDAWVDAFPTFASATGDSGWLVGLREEAIGSLAALGLPHRKLEEWRYTSLAVLEQAGWAPISPDAASTTANAPVVSAIESLALPQEPAGALRAIFVDGQLDAGLSDLGDAGGKLAFHAIAEARRGGAGAELLRAHLGQLAEHKTDAFTALNTAFTLDGAVLEIARGAVVGAPIHLVFVSQGSERLVCPRIVVVAREGSRACVVQSHISTPSTPSTPSTSAEPAPTVSLTNSVVELCVEANADLDWITLQRESDATVHISNVQAHQARDSRLATHTFTLGGALVRNELDVLLGESGAEANLRGLFLAAGKRIADNHTLVDHATPHCVSRELYKGVLGDAARGVFRGRLVVRPDAQKTDARQSNPNLLLTDRAEIDTKPQLEIYANDVKCSHGATIGQLDAEALFYLRSRGLSESDARVLLTRGFANEICDALPDPAIAAWSRAHVAKALRATIGEGSA